MTVNAEIKKARINAGLTQVQLSKKLKTSQSAVARLERDGYEMSFETLRAIAKATKTKLVVEFVK